jgi:hypothetical protein
LCEECIKPKISSYDGKSCELFDSIEYPNGVYYGEVKNGKRSKRGVMIYTSGTYKGGKFEGEFKNGIPDGNG